MVVNDLIDCHSFNSMIVRLKGVRPYCLKKVVFKRFNSMIVRLKVRERKISVIVIKQFQFYDSPIKSCRDARFVLLCKHVSIL